MTIRTRFAPSPTGLLHIGGARTALFNFLYARHHGGQFLLRVEDTDRERSTEAATQMILLGLEWLGITPDEAPVFQSTRQARHTEVALQMLERGEAYRCYLSPEELTAMREQAAAEKRPFRLESPWRDRDPSEAPAGIKPVVRIRAPREGETMMVDLVQGEVRVANTELDDMIILRSDGTPTYLHAVVVDDHDMGITHVIRGDDHLTNTFRQIMVYRANGWDLPHFAHIPLIHGADGAKLSKRHGAVSVLEFRQQGFLPEALCNYLLRLGWGHGDAEIIDRDEAIRLFDVDGVGRAASRMDYAKLTHLNAVYLRQADNNRLTTDVTVRLGVEDEAKMARIAALMPGLKERARTVVELAESARFLTLDIPLDFDAKAGALLTGEARAMLGEIASALESGAFTLDAINEVLHATAERTGRKLGQVAQPIRAALTGTTVSPPIDQTMLALGRDEALARIRAAASLGQ
jgi:glutamyl-tRNA synthetase